MATISGSLLSVRKSSSMASTQSRHLTLVSRRSSFSVLHASRRTQTILLRATEEDKVVETEQGSEEEEVEDLEPEAVPVQRYDHFQIPPPSQTQCC